MGLIYSNARLLLAARREGFSFDNVVTLCRQELLLSSAELKKLGKEFTTQAAALQKLDMAPETFADRFFRECLGSQNIESIDLSDYQEATIGHDLNLTIGDDMRHRFDAVVDAGTLEHVFNFPVALRSCMEMVRVGGCILLATTANNHCGHGFYQFSPELFYRAFQPEHGFQIERVILVEHPFPGAELSPNQRCYEVADPDALGGRVGLVSRRPVMIQVLAKRINDARSLDSFPQQSDYERLWESSAACAEGRWTRETVIPFSRLSLLGKTRRLLGNLYRHSENRLPDRWQEWLVGRRQLRDYSLGNRKYYRPW